MAGRARRPERRRRLPQPDISPHLSLTLNGTNLTNTVRSTYYGITTRPRDSIMSDRQIAGVARITF